MVTNPQTSRRAERRHAPRYPLDAKLEMEWGSETLRGEVRDISAGGMFVSLADPLWLGARFAARLVLDEPLRMECSVRRVEPGRGMGLVFAVHEDESKSRIASLLGSLAGNPR